MLELENKLAVILVATYNGEKYIVEQLKSLLSQTYRPLKIIIADDCSKDSTVELIMDFCNRYDSEKCINIETNKYNKGVIVNFIDLLSKVNENEYVFFCDQDDYWRPDKVEIMMNRMMKLEADKKMPYLICHNYNIADKDNNIYDNSRIEWTDFNALAYNPQIPGCCMMVNYDLVKILDFENIDILMHDWYISLMAAMSGRIEVIDECLINYRQHEDNVLGYRNRVKASVFGKIKDYKNNMPKRYKIYIDRFKQLISIAYKYRTYNDFEYLISMYETGKFLNIAKWHRSNGFFKSKKLYQSVLLYNALKKEYSKR